MVAVTTMASTAPLLLKYRQYTLDPDCWFNRLATTDKH